MKRYALHSVDLGVINGLSGTIEADPDPNFDIREETDWIGTFTDKRVDGSSCKLYDRRGPVWWTPPRDVRSDAEHVASLRKLASDYLGEWQTIAVVTLRLELDGFKGSASLSSVWLPSRGVDLFLIEHAPDLFDDAWRSLQASIGDSIQLADRARVAAARWPTI